eukprot:gene47294-7766_t
MPATLVIRPPPPGASVAAPDVTADADGGTYSKASLK